MSDVPTTSGSSVAIKSLGLSDPLHRYLVDHGTPPDAILRELTEETREKVGVLAALPPDFSFDFAFIDAHKPEYEDYLERLTVLVRPGGLILVDNVLWMGRVADDDEQGDDTVAIRAFNDSVAQDERFDRVMVAISDGITMLRVR